MQNTSFLPALLTNLNCELLDIDEDDGIVWAQDKIHQ